MLLQIAPKQPPVASVITSRRRSLAKFAVVTLAVLAVSSESAQAAAPVFDRLRLSVTNVKALQPPSYRLADSRVIRLESAAAVQAPATSAPPARVPAGASRSASAGRPTGAAPTPASAEAPVRAATSGSGKLTWSPPKLNKPTVIELNDRRFDIQLDDKKDYLLKINGTVNVGSGKLTIAGGHNVVLIGGRINAPGSIRALYLKEQTGTVHVEGVHITGAGLKEGINLDQRKGATVQLQNIRIDQINGSKNGHHADLIQTWAGPDVLRVDRFEGWTTYQSMMLAPEQFGPARNYHYELKNVVTRTTNGEGKYYLTDSPRLNVETSNVVVVGPGVGVKRATAEGIRTGPASTPSPLVGNPGPNYVSPGYAR